MKREILLIFALLIIMPSVIAINVNVEEVSSNNVIILGLDQPATFDITITNKGAPEEIEFYTYLTDVVSDFFPKEKIHLNSGESKTVRIEVYSPEKTKFKGYYTFDYYIRSEDGSEIKQPLMINVVRLEDAFEIGSGEVDLDSETMTVYVHSKVKFDFKGINLKLTSPFFEIEEKIDLGPNKKEEFTVNLNKEDYKKLVAGFYTMKAEIQVGKVKADIEAPIRFIEKDIVTEEKRDYGIIINTKIIKKTNEGNLISKSEVVIRKNIISRLFTTVSPEPNIVDRQGLKIYYTWTPEIKPSETYEIKVRTNWLFPFILILLIIALVIITKHFSNRNLTLKKRVSFVRTKGGEFALKVSIIVKATQYIEKVAIYERLPPLVKLHEKFGVEKPSRVDEKAKRVEWRFDKLEEGETRVLNYILYSKVGVIGKFALPRTSAIFERDGKIYERNSNKAFFVIEQNVRKDEDQF